LRKIIYLRINASMRGHGEEFLSGKTFKIDKVIHMTANDFRRLALSFPGAVQSAHMHHPDFRVRGKIFATLGYPDDDWGMVKLSPVQQGNFIRANSDVFRSAKGAWGRRGNTNVYLPTAKIGIVREALAMAWHNTAPKRLTKVSDSV
jgi:hypothetical protein